MSLIKRVIDSRRRSHRRERTRAILTTASVLWGLSASAAILTAGGYAIEEHGRDTYGRVLASFRVGATTAGAILIAEGLARPWAGRRETWCDVP